MPNKATGARSPPKTDCTEPSNEDKINQSKNERKTNHENTLHQQSGRRF